MPGAMRWPRRIGCWTPQVRQRDPVSAKSDTATLCSNAGPSMSGKARAAGLLHRLSGQRAVTFRRSAAKSTSTGDSSPRDVGRGGERRADRSRPGGERGHYPFAGVHDDLGARQVSISWPPIIKGQRNICPVFW